VQRIIGFLLLALVVWMIVTEPNTAAAIVKEIGVVLRNAATNIIHFSSRVLN
jgi:hypothetical protein